MKYYYCCVYKDRLIIGFDGKSLWGDFNLLLCHFRRLAKSTLLLIPLFGINFIVFAFIPEQVKTELRLIFDLILGSFQVRNVFKVEIIGTNVTCRLYFCQLAF